MEPTCWLCGSVKRLRVQRRVSTLCLTFLGRKLYPHSCFDARYFTSSLFANGSFQATTLCSSPVGMSLIKSMCGFFKWNCFGLLKFLPLTKSPLVFLQPEVMGTYLPDTRTLDWEAWYGAETPPS